jgi:hypothetical protein
MQTGITDAEARVKAKALDVFKFWLLAESRTRADLDAADPVELAKLYPPLEPDDLELMIRVRKRSVK